MKAVAPRVSVIIPCYNGEKFLAVALESALAQTFADLEVIVVDDGSTDGTAAVVAAFAPDSRVRYLHQENRGLSAARNAGVEAARGEFIALLDSDDLWDPSKIALQMKLFECNQDAVFVFTDYTTFDSAGTIALRKLPPLPKEGVNFMDILLRNNFIYPSTVLFRRRVIQEVGGFDEALRSIEDYDMWLRIAKKYQLLCANQSLTQIRQHDLNMSANVRRMLESELTVVQKWREHIPYKAFCKRQAKVYYLAADRYASQRRDADSFCMLLSGLRLCPFCFVDLVVVTIKFILGGTIITKLRRSIDGGAYIGRLYWYLYNRF